MKIQICLALFLGAFSLAGCGSSSDTTGKPVESSDLSTFVSTGPVLDLAKACLPSCTEDSQCQNSCPGVSSGVNCCDVATNMCFVSTTSTCPVPVVVDMAQSQQMY